MSGVFVATLVVRAVQGYLVTGALLALPLVLFGLPRLDPAVRHSTAGFRLMVVPGVVVLWPLLVGRLLRGSPAPRERNAHRACAGRAPTRCPVEGRS